MKKYKGYRYTTKVVGYKERNNIAPIKLFQWFIRNNKGEILQQCDIDIEFESKEAAELDCEQHIEEYYY